MEFDPENRIKMLVRVSRQILYLLTYANLVKGGQG